MAVNGSETYDYIVAGAGAAGCIVANRLSADPARRVLLIEAGGSDESFTRTKFLDIPSLFMLWGPETDWGYSTEPSPAAGNRGIPITQGKVLGGGSSTNGRIFLRGNRRDYDYWAAQGNTGWSYDDVLPYFKRYEDFSGGGNDYHGVGGPMPVLELPDPTPVSRAFLQAAVDTGFRHTDVNGAQQEDAVDFCQSTTTRGMNRASAAVAYIHPIMNRPNFTLKTNTTVTRILFEGTRAVGVEYVENGQTGQVRASSEVIASFGGFNAPKMLMLSGIGPADHLRSMGVPVIADVPGVGQNLQDHLLVRMSWHLKQKQPAPIILSEVNLFTYSQRIHAADESPDLQYMFAPFFFPEYGPVDEGITLVPVVAQPKSRGTIRLRSNNPADPPVISPNYLSAPEDLEVLQNGLELGMELMSSPLMDGFKGDEVVPGSAKTPEQRREYIRNTAVTVWHPSCSNRMGNDRLGVVDPELRVKGVEGLRVIDCSIMPKIPNANLQATVLMIGEKGADLVLGASAPSELAATPA